MKTLKQARTVLFVMLAAFSILPGCGKKNDNNNGAIVGGPIYGYTSGGITSNGQCYNLNGYGNAPATVMFGGSGYIDAAGYLKGTVGPANTGFPGAMYSRTNAAGDTVYAYLTGSTLYASATLAPTTVAWIQTYLGGQICGLIFFTSTSGATLLSSTQIIGPSGPLPLGYISL